MNLEEFLPKIKTPTYIVTAINQKNEKSNNTEVWITNYKESFFFKKNKENWFKQNGYYYSNGNKENFIEIKNQEEIIFIKHAWSGLASIENTKTNKIETIDLYSLNNDNYIYKIDEIQKNLLNNFFIKILIILVIAFIINKSINFFRLVKLKKFRFNIKISDKKTIILSLVFSLLPFVYLIAFYPGLMSADSLDQWKQLTNFEFKDAHPAFHTLIYWLITRIYYNPISVSVFQILCLSTVWTYGIISTLKNLKPNNFQKLIIIVISILFYISPQNGLMSITLWKDVLFSYSILFLTINLFNIIFDKDWIFNKKNKWLLILSLVSIFLLRHNGMIVYASTAISLFILYKIKFIKIFIVSIFIILFIKYPLFNLLKVSKINGSFSSSYSIDYLNGYIFTDKSLKEKYQEFYARLYPQKNVPFIFNSYCINYWSVGIDSYFYKSNSEQINKYLTKEIANNPNIFWGLVKKRSSLLWQVNQPPEAYTYTTPIDDYDSRSVLKNIYNIKSYNPNSKLTFFIRNYIYLSESEKYKSLFWRPALNLILILTISLVFFKRYKNLLVFLILIPILTLSLGLIPTLPGQDYRYLFSNYLLYFFYLLIFTSTMFSNKIRIVNV